MSEEIYDLAEKAAQLISFALRPRTIPAADPDYLELVREFEASATAAQILERIATGLGLRILELNLRAGLVLGTTNDSPFEIAREDYRSTMSGSDRIIQGLIHLAIGSWCFPRAEDLAESDDVLPARLTVEDLVEYIHGLCEELKNRESRNLALPSPELHTAWQHVLALGKYSDSADGRVSFTTLAGKVRHALTFLTRHGMLKRDSTGGREAWLARPTLRIHVRELAGHSAFSIITHAAREAAHG